MNAPMSVQNVSLEKLRSADVAPRIFLGIYRERPFLVGDRDKNLLDRVGDALALEGHRVNFFNDVESALQQSTLLLDSLHRPEITIFNMCRDTANLDKLSRFSQRHQVHVVNTPSSTKALMRVSLYKLMKAHQVPRPETKVLSIDAVYRRAEKLNYPLWVKLPDYHHVNGEGVERVTNARELNRTVQKFWRLRHPKVLILQRDIGQGFETKFYGVYSLRKNKMLFFTANALIPATQQRELEAHCELLAHHTGLQIFGGDCFYSPEEGIQIVDFNSWPSFGDFAAPGAKAIAKCILADTAPQSQESSQCVATAR